MLHYNFPPYSVGEASKWLGTKAGHGWAIDMIVPYTIRVLSSTDHPMATAILGPHPWIPQRKTCS